MDSSSLGRVDRRFDLGAFAFESGVTLPDAYLAYSTYGTFNQARDNVIVAPTWFAGTPDIFEWLIGPGRPLDTNRYFIVAPSLFGNGLSSSPSNTQPPYDRARFPNHTIADNVRAQSQLLASLGVSEVELVFGGSMGAMQAFEWAVTHPSLVRRVFAMCGASTTSEHCALFLEGVRSALLADPSYAGGDFTEPPAAGLRAAARVWCAWSPSAKFYRDREYRQLGFSTAEQFVKEFWEPWYGAMDANNFLNQLWTWQNFDVRAATPHADDLAATLGSISALTYVVPAERDPYFPAEDAAWEATCIPNGELHVIPGTWGHMSLFGYEPSSAEFIRSSIRTLLAQ